MSSAGRDFDHIDPGIAPRLNEVLSALRESGPLVHSREHGGFWAALTHRAVLEVTCDPAVFSSARGIAIPPIFGTITQPPVEYDPPEHTAYRRIIQGQFTRRGAARFEPMLRGLVRARLAELVGAGQADLVRDLARPIPPMAIAMILGLPPEDGERFVEWLARLFATAARGDVAENERVTREFKAYVGARLDEPHDDEALLATIARGEIDGRPLTREEQIGMVVLLVVAGHETTVHGIGTMLYHLAAVEGLRDKVTDDPSLIPAMIGESLRMEAPVLCMGRTVRGGADLAGHRLEDGDRVLMVFNAANHDPAAFDRPEEFVCPRDRNPHVAFGFGIHRCVGEHLALLEMRIVAEEILAMAPGYRLPDGFRPEWVGGRMVRGLTALPAAFP